jgi:AcrR family transcriptional regulator
MISLLRERSWADINIQILCERADIGRSTFYLHFQNKEELLVSGFKDLRKMLLAQAGGDKQGATDSLRFVRGLIEHVHEQRILFRTIIGRSSGHVVQKRFREMVSQLVEEEVLLPATGWERDAGTRYVAGALLELLAWWVDTGTERNADDIENLFYQLTLPAIKSLR